MVSGSSWSFHLVEVFRGEIRVLSRGLYACSHLIMKNKCIMGILQTFHQRLVLRVRPLAIFLRPLQAPRSFMCILTLQSTYSCPALPTLYRAPVAAIVTKLPLWRPSSRRRRSMTRSIRQRWSSKKCIQLSGVQRRRHGAIDGE